jgi:hypothetical protein
MGKTLAIPNTEGSFPIQMLVAGPQMDAPAHILTAITSLVFQEALPGHTSR